MTLMPSLEEQVASIERRLEQASTIDEIEACVVLMCRTPSRRWQRFLDFAAMSEGSREALVAAVERHREELFDAVADGEVIWIHDYSDAEVREMFPEYDDLGSRSGG